MQDPVVPIMYLLCACYELAANYPAIRIFAKFMNWEENRELGVVRLHIFNSRISNSRKIPGPKKHELGGHSTLY